MTSEQTADIGAQRAHDASARELCAEMTVDDIDQWYSMSTEDRLEIVEHYEAGIFSLIEALDAVRGEA